MARKTRPRGHNTLTVLIVPDPTQSPITLRVPTWLFPLLLAVVVALFGGMAVYAVRAHLRIDQLQARLAQEDQVRDVSRSREQEMRTAILSQRDEAHSLKEEYSSLTQQVQTFQSDVTNQVEGMQADVQTEVDHIKTGMDEINRQMEEIRGIVGLEVTPAAPAGEAQPEQPGTEDQGQPDAPQPSSQAEPSAPPLAWNVLSDAAWVLGSQDDGQGGIDRGLPVNLNIAALSQNRSSTLELLADLKAELPAKLAELQQLKEQVASRVERVDPGKRSSPEEIAKQLALIDAAPKGWPAIGSVTSTFGWRYWGRYKEFHTGLDVGVYYRTPIHVRNDGVVTYAGWERGYGWTVEVRHAMGYSTLYGHLSRTLVNAGDKVSAGDLVALSGSSGRSTGPHLHYEIRVNGVPVDPMKFVKMKD